MFLRGIDLEEAFDERNKSIVRAGGSDSRR